MKQIIYNQLADDGLNSLNNVDELDCRVVAKSMSIHEI